MSDVNPSLYKWKFAMYDFWCTVLEVNCGGEKSKIWNWFVCLLCTQLERIVVKEFQKVPETEDLETNKTISSNAIWIVIMRIWPVRFLKCCKIILIN